MLVLSRTNRSTVTLEFAEDREKAIVAKESRLSTPRHEVVNTTSVFVTIADSPHLFAPYDVRFSVDRRLSYRCRFGGPDSLTVMNRRGCKFTVPEVASIAVDLMESLRWLHVRGVVHRDIKPENVTLQRQSGGESCHWKARLIDFDEAQIYPARFAPPHERRLVGTPFFASCRAHLGFEACPRDDVESLIYTLCFLLQGTLPWCEEVQTNRRLPPSEKDPVYAEALKVKRGVTPSELFAGQPPEFGRLLERAREMHSGSAAPWGELIEAIEPLRQVV